MDCIETFTLTKICGKCKKELDINSFYKSTQTKDGLYNRCKECIKIDQKEYRDNNKEKIRERKHQYYINNREEHLKKCKEYVEKHKEQLKDYQRRQQNKNREKLKEYRKQYYHNNKEKLMENQKQYRLSNKERIYNLGKKYRKLHKEDKAKTDKLYFELNKEHIMEYRKQYRIKNRKKLNILNQKYEAKKKKLQHTLTLKQWHNVVQYFDGCCAYCGNKTKLHQDHFIPLCNDGEYTHNNIIPACKSCNSSKKDSDFFVWYPKQETYSVDKEEKILKFLNYENKYQQLSFAI